jgi:hypothetical protein
MNEKPNKDRNPQRNVPKKPEGAPGKPGFDKGSVEKEGWEKNRPARKDIGDPGTKKPGGIEEGYEKKIVEDDDNE